LATIRSPGRHWIVANPAACRFDHTQGGHDDRAIAISLMLIEALERPSPSWHPMYTERDDEWLHKRALPSLGSVCV
jgi:hypothetical protein